MWNNDNTLYSVEYTNLNPNKIAEVDLAIEIIQKFVNTFEWSTTEQWTIYFNPKSELVQLKAWGFLENDQLCGLIFTKKEGIWSCTDQYLK